MISDKATIIHRFLEKSLSPDSTNTIYDSSRLSPKFTVDIDKETTSIEFERKFIDDTKAEHIENKLKSINLIHMISHSKGKTIYVSTHGATYLKK